MTRSARLFCIIVTFRRPEGLERTLRLALSQSCPPVELVVVDNEGSDAAQRSALNHAGGPSTITYLRPGDNLGPAGGTALGMKRILEVASDDDWITRLDDDLDEMDEDVFAELLRFAVEHRAADPSVGAVGAVGSRYDWAKGRLVRIDDAEIEAGPVPVDYVPTNRFPAFNVGTVRKVGVFDSTLFYGSSEVEYGLRLRNAGVRILANPVLWKRLGRQTAATAGPRWTLRDLDWRRYYSLRNQIFVLRTSGHRWTAIKVSVIRGLAKPTINLLVAPAHAWGHLKLNTRAILDGWRGNLGRTLEPW